jgi:hypothetical protein
MPKLILRLAALFLFTTCMTWWVLEGSNRGWTKTSVATMKTDEITGIEYPVWKEKFVPGVDFLAAGSGLSLVLLAVSFLPFLNKSKNKYL